MDLHDLQQSGELFSHLEIELPSVWLQQALASTDAEVTEPGALNLNLHLQTSGTVIVQGHLRFSMMVPCARCLELSKSLETLEILETYVDKSNNFVEGTEDEDEAFRYEGHVIDLQPMLMEQVLLAYPLRVLCFRGEQCLGLCPGCGADRNQFASVHRCDKCGMEFETTTRQETDKECVSTAGNLAWQAALKKIQLS